jgi:hypothetical protein
MPLSGLTPAGLSPERIAANLGITTALLEGAFRRDSRRTARRAEKAAERQVRNARIIALHERGLRIKDIAEVVGTLPGTASDVVNRHKRATVHGLRVTTVQQGVELKRCILSAPGDVSEADWRKCG